MQATSSRLRAARRCLIGAAALVSTLPGWAASWTFSSTAALLLGGFVSGSFSGVDSNADSFLDASEVQAFSVAYTGSPPTTSSFTIDKPSLDGGDSFSFDLASGTLSFAVGDSAGRSVSGGTDQFTAVVGNGSDVDAGGTLTVSAVPEPPSASLAALGGLVLMGASLRRRRR